DAGIVGTERNFAFLRAVGDDAQLGAAEIVVKEGLEPHAGNKEEVPRVVTAFLDVFHRAVGTDLAVILARQAKRFVELLEDGAERQTFWRAVRVVILEQSET